jgi:hypothetical protein
VALEEKHCRSLGLCEVDEGVPKVALVLVINGQVKEVVLAAATSTVHFVSLAWLARVFISSALDKTIGA